MRLWNGMWHDLRKGMIMRNMIYAGDKLTEVRVLFPHQFYSSGIFLMLRTLTECLKTTRQQIEDCKIQGWDKTCLIAG